MSKNLDELKDISIFFTEETLRNVVAKEKNVDKEKIKITHWEFEEISGKGDNYLSVVNRLFVKSELNQEASESRLVVKSLPKNIFRRQLMRSSEYFHNEIVFYEEVATSFQEFLASKGQNQLLCIPQCFAYHDDGDNDFIVLQDVKYLGYDTVSRFSCLPYDQCKSLIETIAKFHAISFAYKDEKPSEFKRLSSILTENFFRNDIYETFFKFVYDDVFRVAKDALEKEYPNSKGQKVFNSLEPSELYKRCIEVCSKTDSEISVISHGDTWAPNFLIRKMIPDKLKILMLDFQIVRCSSPVLDAIFFIYQCTDKALRDKYYDQLLKDYYSELMKSIKLLGANSDNHYPWETFQKEIKEQAVYGLMFALLNVPLSLLPENKAFDLDLINEATADVTDLGTFPNLEKSEDRKRLADIILHAVDRGYI